MKNWDITKYFIKRLPSELKIVIYGFIDIDTRIDLLLSSEEFKKRRIAYNSMCPTTEIYSDYSYLVFNIRIKSILPNLNKTSYFDGNQIISKNHPIMTLLRSDFNYKKITDSNDNIYNIPLMYGFEMTYNNPNGYGSRGLKLIVTEEDWDNMSTTTYNYLKTRFKTYERYINFVKYKLQTVNMTIFDFIYKYFKVASYINDWDYALYKFMLKTYIMLSTSNKIKNIDKKYDLFLIEKQRRKEEWLERENIRRELFCMKKEELLNKKIIANEKRLIKEHKRLLYIEKKRIRQLCIKKENYDKTLRCVRLLF